MNIESISRKYTLLHPLKGGKEVILRPAGEADARALNTALGVFRGESEFLLLQPEEGLQTDKKQQEYLRAVSLNPSRSVVFVAVIGEEIVASLGARRGEFVKCRHVANFSMAVGLQFRRQGLGESLLAMLEKWSFENDIERIEMTVSINNQAGISLYEKCGFKREGIRQQSLKMNGSKFDEFYMAKVLSKEAT